MTMGFTSETGYTYTYAWYSGDNATGTPIDGAQTASYSPTGLGAGSHSYTVRVTATRDDNGRSTTADKTFTVTVSPVRVDVPAAQTALVYTGASQTGMAGGAYYTVENGAEIDAGSYTATLALKDKVNYVWDLETPTDADQSVAWSIGQKPIAVSWGSETSWVYDGQDHVPTAEAAGVAGETITLAVSGSQKDYKASAYTATASIDAVSGGRAKATNYTLTDSTATFTITQRPVTLAWDYTKPFTYGNTPKSVSASITNAVGDDTFTLSYSNNSKTDAGSYIATVTGLGNGNYTLVGATGTSLDWVIQKAPVSFTVTDNSSTYDTAAHTAAVEQAEGSLPTIGSAFTVRYKLSTEELSAATANKTDAGIYDIMVTLTNSNFKFTGQEDATQSVKVGTLTIAQKPIAIQWKDLTQVYGASVKTPTFDFAGSGIEPGDAGMLSVVLATGQSKSAAGSYTVRAVLDGARAGNYVLTNPIGNFIIQRAPVTFTISDDCVVYDGDSHAATVTADIIDAAKFTVSYRDSRGNPVDAPTDAGNYDVCVAITDANYHHAAAADGVARKIGVLTIYSASVPATYTVSFAGGAGAAGTTGALAAAQAGTVRILPTCNFAVTGKIFTGWKFEDSVYQPGERLTQPAANITLTAQWAENAYTIAGIVDQNNVPLADVVITLMLGSKQLGQTTTDADGRYSFSNVLPGIYNLVANKNGVTQTILAEIVSANVTGQRITMPAGKTNSVVEVAAGSPAIVVGNLEQSFASTESANKKSSPETKKIPQNV